MIYLMLLCGFLLVFVLFCFVFFMRGRLSRQMLLGICIVCFVISLLFPMRWVLCNPILKEQVAVTTLKDKNAASLAWDVIINYFDTNYSERKIENPVEGKWAWWNGSYVWFDAWEPMGLEPTDTVVFEIPVGNQRSIVFTSGPRCGKAKITCMGISQQVDLYSEEENTSSVQLPPSESGVYERDILLRAAVFFLMTLLITFVVAMTAIFIIRKTNWRVILNWKYEILVFLLSLMNIILMGRYPDSYAYSFTYYFLPYERGFGSRGLLGTLTLILGGSYVEHEVLTRCIVMILALAYLFFSILIVRYAKRETDTWMGVFWVLLYLLTPFTFMDVFDDTRDLYLIILFLCGVIMINKNRFVQLLPILCVVMILLNETSSVFFIAPLLALLLYFSIRERNLGYFFSFLSSAAFTCITTLKILLLDKDQLMPIDSYYAHMSLHTDAALDYNAFRAEYRTAIETIKDYAYWMGSQIPYFHNHELMITSLLYFVLLIPFVILFAIMWKAIYIKLTVQRTLGESTLLLTKFLYWIMLLSSCGGVICMLMAWDYLRFSKCIMIASMSIMFTLITKEKLTLQISDMFLFTPPKQRFPILPFVILLYMSFWGTVSCWGPDTEFLNDLAQILRGFLHIK